MLSDNQMRLKKKLQKSDSAENLLQFGLKKWWNDDCMLTPERKPKKARFQPDSMLQWSVTVGNCPVYN